MLPASFEIDEQTFLKMKFGQGFLMVWTEILAKGESTPAIISGSKTSKKYAATFCEHLLQMAESLHGENVTFQQDRAPTYTA